MNNLRTVQTTAVPNLADLEDEPESVPNDPDYALNLALFYHDQATRAWAMELCARVSQIAGEAAVRPTWWSIPSISNPTRLTGAVSAAAYADAVVIAMRATTEMPLAVYVWAEAWLDRCHRDAGALIALMGLPQNADGQPPHVEDFLAGVARQAGLEFLVQRRILLPEPAAPTRTSVIRMRDSVPSGNRLLPHTPDAAAA
jgi:hypothetical protein